MQLTGKVNPVKAIPYALQQILCMFVTNLVPILTIAALCNLSDDMVTVLTQNAMVISGIATLIATIEWE